MNLTLRRAIGIGIALLGATWFWFGAATVEGTQLGVSLLSGFLIGTGTALATYGN